MGNSIKAAALAVAGAAAVAGCTEADLASRNLSKASEEFEVTRRVVFLNSMTGEYHLEVVGRCSVEADQQYDNQLEVTCKDRSGLYRKHFLGLNHTTTYVVEQLDPKMVSSHHYRVIFKPQAIVPDVDFRGDLGELVTDPD